MSDSTTTDDVIAPRGIALRPFSVEEYRRLGSLGILGQTDRVELLDGVISPKMIHTPIHDATVCAVEALIRHCLPQDWLLRIQCAITTANSEPEPDLAVVKAPNSRYVTTHPHGHDIGLIVEVAETSLERDRVKAGIYAMAGVPVYWIVDLSTRQLEAYNDPREGKYRQLSILQPSDRVAIQLGDSNVGEIAVCDLFPTDEDRADR